MKAANGDWQAAIEAIDDAKNLSRQQLDVLLTTSVDILISHLQFKVAADRIEAHIPKRRVLDNSLSSWSQKFALRGAFAEAARVEKLRIERDGKQPRLWYRLGTWLEESGTPAEATQAFARSIELARKTDLAGDGHFDSDGRLSDAALEAVLKSHFYSSYWYRPIGNRGPTHRFPDSPHTPLRLIATNDPDVVWQFALCHLIGIHSRNPSPGSESILIELGTEPHKVHQFLGAIPGRDPNVLQMGFSDSSAARLSEKITPKSPSGRRKLRWQ